MDKLSLMSLIGFISKFELGFVEIANEVEQLEYCSLSLRNMAIKKNGKGVPGKL